MGAYATGDRSAAALGGDLAAAALDLLGTVDARYAAATAPASADPSLRALRALATQAGGSGLAAALAGADAGLPDRIGQLAGLAATLDAVAADPTLAAAQLGGAADQLAADRLAADVLGTSALTALTGPLATAIDDGLDGDATVADATSTLAAAASDADGWTPAATGVSDVAAPGRWALAARGLAALAVARPGALAADERDRLDAASATGTALQATLAGIGPLGDELCAYRALALGAGSAPGCTAPAGGPQSLADALDDSEQAARDAIAGYHAGTQTGTAPTQADGLELDLWGAPTQGSDFAAAWAASDDTATPCQLGADPYGTSSHIPNPKAGVSGAITPPASVTPDIVPPAYGLADRLGLGSLALCWTLENPAAGPQVDFKWFYRESADHRLAKSAPILPFPVAEQVFCWHAALLGGRLRQRLPLPALDRRLDGLLDGDLRRRAEAVG